MENAHVRTCLNLASALILILGLGSAVWIYQTAANASKSVLGYEEGGGSLYPVAPEDSKMFMRDLELYGGKANVFAYQLRGWFTGLWHGKSLAVVVGCQHHSHILRAVLCCQSPGAPLGICRL